MLTTAIEQKGAGTLFLVKENEILVVQDKEILTLKQNFNNLKDLIFCRILQYFEYSRNLAKDTQYFEYSRNLK